MSTAPTASLPPGLLPPGQGTEAVGPDHSRHSAAHGRDPGTSVDTVRMAGGSARGSAGLVAWDCCGCAALRVEPILPAHVSSPQIKPACLPAACSYFAPLTSLLCVTLLAVGACRRALCRCPRAATPSGSKPTWMCSGGGLGGLPGHWTGDSVHAPLQAAGCGQAGGGAWHCVFLPPKPCAINAVLPVCASFTVSK